VDPATLRKALLAFLPEYMIPSAFVHLDHFPLTPNRKIDRNALPAPQYLPRRESEHEARRSEARASWNVTDRRYPAQASDCPSNHVEQVMTEIWQQVLGLERVSVLDNFFEIGGHSLSAARLIGQLRIAFSMELPLRCIFIHPTIAELSA